MQILIWDPKSFDPGLVIRDRKSCVSDPDPHRDGHLGSETALEMRIPDPDPAAIK